MRPGAGALMSLLRHHLALGFTLFQKAPGLLDRVQRVAGGRNDLREEDGISHLHFCPHFFVGRRGNAVWEAREGRMRSCLIPDLSGEAVWG